MLNAELPFGQSQWKGTKAKDRLVRVALPVPLDRQFDYRVPKDVGIPATGSRVLVPFGHRKLVGVVTGQPGISELEAARIKDVESVLDEKPCVSGELLQLARWIASYYHRPLGEVIATCLPAALKRQKIEPRIRREFVWRLTDEGKGLSEDELVRAPKQLAVLRLLDQGELTAKQLNGLMDGWRAPMDALRKKGFVDRFEVREGVPAGSPAPFSLNAEQAAAAGVIGGELDRFSVQFIYGITGSGKTEVYLQLINQVVERGQQVLMLVPEIALAPQTINRVRSRVCGRVGVSHSGLSDGERVDTYLRARRGLLDVVIGTRSAVFTDFQNLGLIVIDEEHDGSYKQNDGVRYNARDVAIVRGRQLNIPVVMGSATPSLETYGNVRRGLYREHRLMTRATGSSLPAVRMIDTTQYQKTNGLSYPMVRAIGQCLDRGEQALLFLNRRGFAPVLVCRRCHTTVECRHCSVTMTYHLSRDRLKCHVCGESTPVPSGCSCCSCRDSLELMGDGTEKVEEELRARFPKARILRIDRDTTRARGSLEAMLDSVRDGEPCILLGTQMLAQGHDLPLVTLVGMLNVDQALSVPDLRAEEIFAQLFVQVSGRAGRADRPGEVVLQTANPGNPVLALLNKQGYLAFADYALAERREAQMPPAVFAACLRTESVNAGEARFFLEAAARASGRPATVEVCGPAPCLIERIKDRYRFQLIFQSRDRKALHSWLSVLLPWLSEQPGAGKIRYHIDVDPRDMC